MRLAIIFVLCAAPALARAETLNLVCHGTAIHAESQSTFASLEADDGSSAHGSATTIRRQRSDEMVRVRIAEDGGGTIKVPQALIPPISRGRDGWWDFTKLATAEDTIRGEFSLNMINHPKVVIDRRTGDIDMRGLNLRFSGTCEREAEAPGGKKF